MTQTKKISDLTRNEKDNLTKSLSDDEMQRVTGGEAGGGWAWFCHACGGWNLGEGDGDVFNPGSYHCEHCGHVH